MLLRSVRHILMDLIVVFCIVSCLYLCLRCCVSVSLPNFRRIKICISCSCIRAVATKGLGEQVHRILPDDVPELTDPVCLRGGTTVTPMRLVFSGTVSETRHGKWSTEHSRVSGPLKITGKCRIWKVR